AVDFVCKGEGEIPLLTLVDHLEKGLSAEGIANIWWKQNGQVIVNPVGMWVQELDDLPFEDREIFDFARIVDRRHGWAEVISTRGCPYECTYCFNRAFFDMYQIANTELRMKDYIRRRNVDSAIQMLLEVRERYPNVKYFTFVDDIFGLIGEWLINFCNEYHDKVGVTFACTSQPRSFNRRVAALLSHAGCKVLKMGVEAGNYYLRRHVLKRNISDECLIDAFDAAREYNLKPQAFNMIGLPTETKENIQETIRLNANLRPYIVWMSTFMPYPGTELWQFCQENDLIDNSKWDVVNSYRGDSVLRENYISNIDLRKMRTMFKWYLNSEIGNEVSDTYRQNIQELNALPEDHWQDETARQIFQERDEELDERFRRLKYDHYVTKKYVNVYWGKLYNYDLT
ncbi:MAG: radical SAM protein, partial [Chloroflexi bacterium]|nr:radical SAM protein [Chloroflexota bacterium]